MLQEILIHSCRHLVENVSFFNNLSSTMLVRLVMVLKSEIYLKNQEIIKIRTIGDCMFFLSSGTVAVYSASGREVRTFYSASVRGAFSLRG
jgi:signal-transduction protein with cAMP-binding, CBS, and nucleotidyltransferase domain